MTECHFEICIPDEARKLDQNEEWIEIVRDGEAEKIRLHDYGRFYEIPGLYDELYRRLQCTSPRVVCEALKSQVEQSGGNSRPLRALDFGAGNGQVGERLAGELGCEAVVGLDIIPQAKDAARRDRPGVYEDYFVADLARPTDEEREALSRWRFDTLVTVAALGYGDIGAEAFANAYDLVEDGGWVAFNIKDRFLSEKDETGFGEAIGSFVDDGFELVHSRRYRHRYSLGGEPLHYHVIVGRKHADSF